MKLQQFNGGLNSILRPQFLQQTQGAVYENIDSDVGSLTPIRDIEATDIELKPYHTYYRAENAWVDSDVPRDWLEFQQRLYWTDRVTPPQKLNGAVQSNLGINSPYNVGDIDAWLAIDSPVGMTIAASTPDVGMQMKDYYYLCFTIYQSVTTATLVRVAIDGTVTEPEKNLTYVPYPPVKTPEDQTKLRAVNFSGWTDEGELQVYRLHNYEWRFVGVIDKEKNPQLVDNYEDISANKKLDEALLPQLDGVYQYLLTYYNDSDGSESGPSPLTGEIDVKGGGYVTFENMPVSLDPQVTHKRLYRVGGEIAVFTLVAEVGNTTQYYADKLGDMETLDAQLAKPYASPAPVGLAFIQEAYAMLFGALGSYLRFTPIGKPDNWPEAYFIQYDSPITGIAPVANGVLVFTKFRTYIVTGSGPTSLSSFLLSSDQGCIAYESVQMRGTEAIWVSTDGVCRSAGNLPEVMSKASLGKVSFDPVSSAMYDETYYVLNSDSTVYAFGGGIVKTYSFGYSSLTVANDKLYGYIYDRLWDTFVSAEPATFRYVSPRFTEGTFTNSKSYKKIFVYSTGYVIIDVLIDDVVVQTKELTTTDNHTIQVPQDLQRGHYIQFKIMGTGEVFEIEYTVGDPR